MNCFPCKGPTCNSCAKYDRLLEKVRKNVNISCPICGERVDVLEGHCLSCKYIVIAPPGMGSIEE